MCLVYVCVCTCVVGYIFQAVLYDSLSGGRHLFVCNSDIFNTINKIINCTNTQQRIMNLVLPIAMLWEEMFNRAAAHEKSYDALSQRIWMNYYDYALKCVHSSWWMP